MNFDGNTIQVGIALINGSEDYALFLMETIKATMSGKNEFEFIFALGQNGIDIGKIKNNEYNFKTKFIENPAKILSSTAHSKSLSMLYNEMDSKYCILVDCDVAFLMKGWDERLLEIIDSGKTIVGCEYHDHMNLATHYNNFPNLIFSLFNLEKMRNANVVIEAIEGGTKLITKDMESIYNVSVGRYLSCDTGYSLPLQLQGQGLALKSVRGDGMKLLNRLDIRGNSVYLEHFLDNELISVHLGESRRRKFNKDKCSRIWVDKVRKYLEL